jgi:hypothetical protein
MGGLRRWMRRVEHDAIESADMTVLVDEETGEEFKVPHDAFLRVLCAAHGDEPDPEIAPLLDRLQRLFYTNGDPFWWQPAECYAQEDHEK